MANVSYLRPATSGRDRRRPARGQRHADGHPPRRGRYVVGGLLLAVLAALAAAGVALGTSHARLTGDPAAAARVTLPLGGGTIQSATLVTGPHASPVPVAVRDGRIWPLKAIPARQSIEIDVVVRRPGFISWLTGRTERLHLSLITPAASLRSHFLTLPRGAPLQLRFKEPIRQYAFGQRGHLRRVVLATPRSAITLRRPSLAGTIFLWAAPRTWESARTSSVSWFPAGAGATAVANPAPGATIHSSTPITLTFSRPVAKVLGAHLPPVLPDTAGSWHALGDHAIVFRPLGFGYGLGAHVTIPLPSSVRLIGAQRGSAGTWNVPPGSTQRLQQLLAELGYLPLDFHPTQPVSATPAAQEAAAVKAPAGSFTWRWQSIPAALRSMWSPGTFGTMTRGAVMAFENDHGMAPDGVAGPQVWRALIDAAVAARRSTFGYTFVMVSESSPESLTLWHNGSNVLSDIPVNTGIASAPTAQGTFPVFEHIRVGTMSGTNPDGSHYSDPGIPYISYFNGGDALHGFLRAQYGSPQSLGCVEMTYADAGRVWPYTPVGTLVHVS